ncbi:uncharacterized protein LOC113291266 [Papaver somniferum]|uniref:uncharacterized protein LOC113291266 n=1 Tax=Papaver somniferum TaxID=3469 RepID=UPI000E703776|nr:uncharacterized protein LOC113291266 [Papaver somniferum]
MTNGGDPIQPSNVIPEKDTGLSPTSPYYVHPSDNLTSLIYSPLLTSDNYCTWGRGMMKALSAKGKTGYIDGTVKKPTNATDLAHWTRCDDLVGRWISNSVDPEIRSSTQNFSSAHEQWLDIKSRFSHHNASKLYALKQSIALLKQDNLSVAMYYTRLKSLWDQLDAFRPIEPCICGAGFT